MSQARVWNPPGRRAVRWALWLAAGIAFGVLAGFAAALSQPRQESGLQETGGQNVGPTAPHGDRPEGIAEESAR